MFNFKMPPFAYTIFNDSQIMYIPDEYSQDPGWENLRAKFQGDEKKVIEVTDNQNNVLFLIGNPEMFIPMLRSKEHFIGWESNGALHNREIHLDISRLLDGE